MAEASSSLGLASALIERVHADLVAVPLFRGEHPLRGAVGRIDWRLCGRLSHLCAAGSVSGEPGRAVLIPGGGGVRASRVLVLGLGLRADLDAPRWRDWVGDALARARGLRAHRLVTALPLADEAVGDRLLALARAIVDEQHPLEVLLAPEASDEAAASEWLRSAARRSRPAGLEIHPPGEARSPHGASPPSRASESSQPSAGRFTR
jgi:hypothetical protein